MANKKDRSLIWARFSGISVMMRMCETPVSLFLFDNYFNPLHQCLLSPVLNVSITVIKKKV